MRLAGWSANEVARSVGCGSAGVVPLVSDCGRAVGWPSNTCKVPTGTSGSGCCECCRSCGGCAGTAGPISRRKTGVVTWRPTH